ncbi:hypothetical protein MOQ33_24285 [Escherichia coli]
MYFTD